jgi:hypothetical protein
VGISVLQRLGGSLVFRRTTISQPFFSRDLTPLAPGFPQLTYLPVLFYPLLHMSQFFVIARIVLAGTSHVRMSCSVLFCPVSGSSGPDLQCNRHNKFHLSCLVIIIPQELGWISIRVPLMNAIFSLFPSIQKYNHPVPVTHAESRYGTLCVPSTCLSACLSVCLPVCCPSVRHGRAPPVPPIHGLLERVRIPCAACVAYGAHIPVDGLPVYLVLRHCSCRCCCYSSHARVLQ